MTRQCAALGLFTMLLAGCGAYATREDLVRYYTRQLEQLRSPQFRSLMQTDPEAALAQTRRNMARCGFESLEELMAVTKRYQDDPDVKALLEKIRTVSRQWPPPADETNVPAADPGSPGGGRPGPPLPSPGAGFSGCPA